MSDVSDASFWEQVYREGSDRWELGRVAPPLARWIGANPDVVRGAHALVIGCGRGHEVRALARGGAARAVGVDFALDAIEAARALAAEEGVAIELQQRDMFTLDENGAYDLVLEHTCYCAIDPARRAEYVDIVARLLRPGGLLVGLFYAHGRAGGPPFTTSDEELHALFGPPRFEVLSYETPDDSIDRRAGEERLVVLRRS